MASIPARDRSIKHAESLKRREFKTVDVPLMMNTLPHRNALFALKVKNFKGTIHRV